MAQLPQELIVEILEWMPVNSVLRCRCLSKSLSAVIDSTHFTKSHLCKSSQNFNLRKLIFSDEQREKLHVCDWNLDLEKEILHLEKPVSSLSREICGNCKGLVLLQGINLVLLQGSKFGNLFLWNPSTGQYRDLPDCPFMNYDTALVYGIIGSGLGYDDSTDDFKALVMGKVVRGNTGVEVQVWIYRLKSNIWRRAPNLSSAYQNEDFQTEGLYYADGSLYWLRTLFTNRNDNQLLHSVRDIVAFDVGKETFSLVPLPACCSIDYPELHVLEDCLCISYFYDNDSTPSQADLYIRKRDGVDKFSWTKLFSVTESLSLDMQLSSLRVLGYSKNRNKILLDLGMAHMAWYDLKEKRLGKVEIDKDPTWESPILCIESLVSVSGGA